MSGKYILFEGIDTSGKSTQIELLKAFKPEWIYTKEPGGSSLGGMVKDAVMKEGEGLDAAAESFLFLADRAQHYKEVIYPALCNGSVVVSDRGLVSGIAYAGVERLVDGGFRFASDNTIDFLLDMNRYALGSGVGLPDIVFLFQIGKEAAEERLFSREGKMIDAIEGRGLEYLMRVQESMEEVVAPRLENEGVEVVFVDGEESMEYIHANIVATLKENGVIK